MRIWVRNSVCRSRMSPLVAHPAKASATNATAPKRSSLFIRLVSHMVPPPGKTGEGPPKVMRSVARVDRVCTRGNDELPAPVPCPRRFGLALLQRPPLAERDDLEAVLREAEADQELTDLL